MKNPFKAPKGKKAAEFDAEFTTSLAETAEGLAEHIDAHADAVQLITRLANSTPNLMGTAHGIALIHDAQKWLAQHVVSQ